MTYKLEDVSQGDMNVGLWQPIDTAPKDGTKILVYSNSFEWDGWPNEIVDTHNSTLIVHWGDSGVYARHSNSYNGKGDAFLLTGGVISDVYNTVTVVKGSTHWMPLPQPPTSRSSGACEGVGI